MMSNVKIEKVSFTKEINRRMLEMARAKAVLKISVNQYSDDSTISTGIVDVNEEKRIIGVSSFLNAEQKPVRLPGSVFHVVTTLGGITYRFITQKAHAHVCSSVYEFTYPSELEYIQRRAHYRVPVPPGQASFATDKNSTALLTGELQDISVSGMRIMTSDAINIDTPIGASLANCKVSFSGTDSVMFSAYLRFKKEIENGRFVLGIEIKDIDNQQRSRIERFVASRDREVRKTVVGM